MQGLVVLLDGSRQLVVDNQTITDPLYPYIGEWRSEIFSPTADKLCFHLDVFAPEDQFWLDVDLLTGDRSTPEITSNATIFQASGDGEIRLQLQTKLPLNFQPSVTSLAQLVVYVSANVVLNNISWTASNCSEQKNTGWYNIILIY